MMGIEQKYSVPLTEYEDEKKRFTQEFVDNIDETELFEAIREGIEAASETEKESLIRNFKQKSDMDFGNRLLVIAHRYVYVNYVVPHMEEWVADYREKKQLTEEEKKYDEEKQDNA